VITVHGFILARRPMRWLFLPSCRYDADAGFAGAPWILSMRSLGEVRRTASAVFGMFQDRRGAAILGYAVAQLSMASHDPMGDRGDFSLGQWWSDALIAEARAAHAPAYSDRLATVALA